MGKKAPLSLLPCPYFALYFPSQLSIMSAFDTMSDEATIKALLETKLEAHHVVC